MMRRTGRLGQLSRCSGVPGALVLLLWLVALVLGMGSVLGRLALPTWGNPLGEARSPELHGGSHLAQRFEAPLPGLAGVEVTIHPVAPGVGRRVSLRLAEAESGRVLGEETLDAGPEASAVKLRLEMTPVAGSQGKPFLLSLDAEAPAGQGMTVGYGPSSSPPGAVAYHDGRAIDGCLQFQTEYSPSRRQKAELILNLLASASGSGTGLPDRALSSSRKALCLAAGLAGAALLLLFVWQVAQALARPCSDGSAGGAAHHVGRVSIPGEEHRP